jgi:type IV pilus assembly protein PilQ
VVVSEDFSRDLGVRFGFTGTETNGSNGLFATSGTAGATDLIGSSAITNLQGGGGVYPVNVPVGTAAPSRYNVNLPAANPAGTLAMMVLGSDYIVDLELSAAQAEGNGEVISSPSIMATNQKEAFIEQGTEIPYQESTSQGATSVSFKEASLSLEVTPQITPDGWVIMEVRVTKDEPDYLNKLNDVPPIKKNEVNAKVLVKDGATIVIGGVLSNTQSKVVDKVPFLGDVPYLGRLFRRDVLAEKKSELLVFLTPRIMNNQAIAVSR